MEYKFYEQSIYENTYQGGSGYCSTLPIDVVEKKNPIGFIWDKPKEESIIVLTY